MSVRANCPRLGLVLLCSIVWLLVEGTTGGADLASTTNSAGSLTLDFGVFWPPRDPSAPVGSGTRALLNGQVVFRVENPSSTNAVLQLHLTLTRPSDEAAREFWNWEGWALRTRSAPDSKSTAKLSL